MSLRDSILNADDIDSELLEVPAWNVTIEVRSMDGRSRTRLIKSAADEFGNVDVERLYPDVVILCAFDPSTGERIFDESDRDALLSKAAGPLEQVAQTALRVSGMTPDAIDAAGKGSTSIPSDGSSSS